MRSHRSTSFQTVCRYPGRHFPWGRSILTLPRDAVRPALHNYDGWHHNQHHQHDHPNHAILIIPLFSTRLPASQSAFTVVQTPGPSGVLLSIDSSSPVCAPIRSGRRHRVSISGTRRDTPGSPAATSPRRACLRPPLPRSSMEEH